MCKKMALLRIFCKSGTSTASLVYFQIAEPEATAPATAEGGTERP